MSEPGSIIRTLAGRPVARNFHTYVINEVGRAIVSGQIKVGGILPGDSEMMARFGVSRTVLREALKTLEAKGLVEARAKVGTRVLPQSRWSLYDRQVLAWVFESGPSPGFLRPSGWCANGWRSRRPVWPHTTAMPSRSACCITGSASGRR